MVCIRALALAVLVASGVSVVHASPSAPRDAEPSMVAVGAPARTYRDIAWARHGALDRGGLTDWVAIYDRDTDVPLRLWGPGLPVAGAMADPAIAEQAARAFLAAHVDMLAPGATAADFVVVANQLDPAGDVRSIGFAQRANGIAVLGGTVSFTFKRDRLVLVGSTALPGVALAVPRIIGPPAPRLAADRVASSAVSWLAGAGHTVAARGVAADQVIVPIVHHRGAGAVDVTYTLAEQVAVETTSGSPGRWNVFVDASSGAAVARQAMLMFESGTVLYDVSNRGPQATAGRAPQPAPNTTHHVNGSAATSDADGVVLWSGTDPASVVPGLSGTLVAVTNKAGPLISDTLSLPSGGSVVWSHADDAEADAQIASYIYANQVKRYAKAHINPSLAYLDQQVSVNVNETPGTCNAYSTGDDIHFFPETPGVCENTARIADLVYHEYGHSIHRHSIIPGVGQFDGAMSEGVADTLAVAMTGDSGVGRGFFLNNDPLRELDPAVKKVWPTDLIGEVHHDGEIYGETMWDLRTNLQRSMGTDAGFAHFLQLYYDTVQRATDIPSSFAEVLVGDDDDGDLSNGTPHDCDIIAAFAAHGLFDPVVSGEIRRPTRNGFTVSLAAAPPATVRCSVPTVQSAELAWRKRGGQLQSMPLTAAGNLTSATIPTQPDGTVIEYNVTLTLTDGTTQVFPDNNADPFYQFYVGNVTRIWCAGFEDGMGQWTHATLPSAVDRWEAGPPLGLGGDPAAAYDGTSVLGIELDGDGLYAASATTTATSPAIDLHGHTSVHLQYYRWLTVEDGMYDQATISANGSVVWRNLSGSIAPRTTDPVARVASSSLDHIDREWQFQDIDVSAQTATGKLQLAFGLVSNASFQAGGWNIDDVCLVAPGGTCPGGNAESCEDEASSAGCCGTSRAPASSAMLALFVLGALVRRRQRLRSLR